MIPGPVNFDLTVIGLAFAAMLLLATVIVLAVLAILAWSRTRNLTWRVRDLEEAVRRLQADRSSPRDVGGSAAIRD